LAIARVAGRGGPAGGRASDGEPLEERSVEADIELLSPAHAHDVVLILAAQTNLDEIFPVDGKVVAKGHAAAGSEGQVFALLIVLHHVQRNLEPVEPATRGRQADGKARHLARDRQVPFQMGR
jgi:hypothetical protein